MIKAMNRNKTLTWALVAVIAILLILVLHFALDSASQGSQTNTQSSQNNVLAENQSAGPVVTDKCTSIGQNYFTGHVINISNQHSETDQDEYLLEEYVYNPKLDTCLLAYYHIHNDPLWEHYDEYLIFDSVTGQPLLRWYNDVSFTDNSPTGDVGNTVTYIPQKQTIEVDQNCASNGIFDTYNGCTVTKYTSANEQQTENDFKTAASALLGHQISFTLGSIPQ